jgi:hypothetical protein
MNMLSNQQDATNLLIEWLRNPDHGNHATYGYEIYLPALVRRDLAKNNINYQDHEKHMRQMMPMLYAAAWDLCRRGILRPGIKTYGEQGTPDGASGNGYTITPFGKQWLDESDGDTFVPTEPERFAQMLAPYRDLYGNAFQERAQEAIRCYGARVYLACCILCGAAAESILLATAIAKSNETEVLSQYRSANGRKKVENLILGKARQNLQEEHKSYMALLKYWRDMGAHGRIANIKDNEAYTSLALLLRFAIFTKDNWEELTAN